MYEWEDDNLMDVAMVTCWLVYLLFDVDGLEKKKTVARLLRRGRI